MNIEVAKNIHEECERLHRAIFESEPCVSMRCAPNLCLDAENTMEQADRWIKLLKSQVSARRAGIGPIMDAVAGLQAARSRLAVLLCRVLGYLGDES